jgi:NAD(P)-dependent dehydrogenase (short-subunit alcohol dehydrogenase family)
MTELGYDGKVAIITGAGGGLGRQHALLLASRGALIVVNDLGGSVDGTGANASAAQKVVDEIKAAGGEAVANHSSVATPEGGQEIVQTASTSSSTTRASCATRRSTTWSPT